MGKVHGIEHGKNKNTSVVFFDVINLLYSRSKKLKKVAVKNIFRDFLRIYK